MNPDTLDQINTINSAAEEVATQATAIIEALDALIEQVGRDTPMAETLAQIAGFADQIMMPNVDTILVTADALAQSLVGA